MTPTKGLRYVVHVQVLVQGVAVAADQDRLAFADAIDPLEIPADLAHHALHRAIGGGRLENDCRELFGVPGSEVDIVRGGFVAPIVGAGPQRMSLVDRENSHT
jgi:hypothetical protein